METPIQKFYKDSGVLQSLDPNEDFYSFLNNPNNKQFREAYRLLFNVYEGNYPSNDIGLLKYINATIYLECENKLLEFLIFLHFNPKKDIIVSQLDEIFLEKYENIKINDTLQRTFIIYNVLDPLKLFTLNVSDFIFACKNGYLEAAQWFYEIGIENGFIVNIILNEDNAFILACINGHLEVAKWLYSFIGTDIHAKNDTIFKQACRNGHLKVAQWLYSLGGINIRNLRDDIYFRIDNGEILEWLNTL